jgi:hypothetical protein
MDMKVDELERLASALALLERASVILRGMDLDVSFRFYRDLEDVIMTTKELSEAVR